uniref:Helicase C-terminal domain-containing protein n=1 Tax=viral metagenome TaxID=1070528 RepID=A0A6C0BCW5_9ZZZZ
MSGTLDIYLNSIPNPPNIYPHQKDAIEWMYNQWNEKEPILLGDAPGMGKTIDVCMLLELVKAKKALLVVPTSTIYQWIRALLTYSKSYYVYTNNNHQLRQTILSPEGYIIHSGFADMNILNNDDGICKVTVCNYHSVVPFPGISDRNGVKASKYEVSQPLDQHIPELTPFNNIHWDIVVGDEIHKIRNGVNTKLDPGEARGKMLMYHRLMRLQMNPVHSIRVGLTGTPVQNRYSDVISILSWMGLKMPPRISIDNTKQFLAKYMFRRTEDNLHPALRSLIFFPEVAPIEHDIDVIYESQAEADVYRIVAGAMTGESVPGGNQNPYSRVQCEENPLVKTTYLRLLSADINLFIKSHNKRYKGILLPEWRGTTSKLSMITQKIEDLGRENESVIVFVHFKEERDAIKEKVWQRSQSYGMGPSMGFYTFDIDGDVKPEDRDTVLFQTKKLISEGRRCIVYATMQSSAEGLNMQHFCKVIIATTDWNPANELQAIKRTHRIGQKRVVEVFRYIHRYVIDAENKIHIDVRVEDKKKMKKAKSDELITGSFNAARKWPIRAMQDFDNEACVHFDDIYNQSIEDAINSFSGLNIDDKDKKPDIPYFETLIGGSGKRVYKENDTGKLVDSFYQKAGQSSGITGMSTQQQLNSKIQNPFGSPQIFNPSSTFNMSEGKVLGSGSEQESNHIFSQSSFSLNQSKGPFSSSDDNVNGKESSISEFIKYLDPQFASSKPNANERVSRVIPSSILNSTSTSTSNLSKEELRQKRLSIYK